MLTSVFVHFKIVSFKSRPLTHISAHTSGERPQGGGGRDSRAWWLLTRAFPCAGFDTSIRPICKDSLGWMFNKLDMNYDLLLDHSEINAIYLDKYEPCIKPLFNSCDSFKDGKLSNNEWCYCFQKPAGEAGGRGRTPTGEADGDQKASVPFPGKPKGSSPLFSFCS